jgi:hypothetical protein
MAAGSGMLSALIHRRIVEVSTPIAAANFWRQPRLLPYSLCPILVNSSVFILANFSAVGSRWLFILEFF